MATSRLDYWLGVPAASFPFTIPTRHVEPPCRPYERGQHITVDKQSTTDNTCTVFNKHKLPQFCLSFTSLQSSPTTLVTATVNSIDNMIIVFPIIFFRWGVARKLLAHVGRVAEGYNPEILLTGQTMDSYSIHVETKGWSCVKIWHRVLTLPVPC